MQSIEIDSADGTPLPLNWFAAAHCQGALLVLPALGIQAKLYSPLAQAVSDFCGPVISIAFDRDAFATDAAIDRALSPFTASQITRLTLGSAEQGEHLGHVGWARDPQGVSEALLDWLERNF